MPRFGSNDFKVLLLDGYNLLGAKPQGIAWKRGIPLERSDGLGDEWDEYAPTGRQTGSVTQSGAFFDTTANSMHAALKDAPTTSRLLAFAPAGNTIGSIFVGFEGVTSVNYDVIVKGAGLTKANAAYQVSGKVEPGVIVQDWVAKTVDWNTKTDGFPVDFILDPTQTVIPIVSNSIANPTVITTSVPHGLASGDLIYISGVASSSPTINGTRAVTVISPTTFSTAVNVTVGGTGGSFVRSNTSAGGVGYLEVSDYTGFTGFIGKIRDSADDVTYADLITFANMTASGAQRVVEVAGVIDRYLSFDGNVTGTGSLKAFSGFKRS